MTIQSLLNALDERAPHLATAEKYYNGDNMDRGLSILVPPELRYLQETLRWVRLATGIFEERCELRSVIAPGYDNLAAELRRIYKTQEFDETASFAILEALIGGRGYISVSGGDDGRTPTFAAETAHNMVHDIDPRTRETTELVRVYEKDKTKRLVYYTPNRTEYLAQDRNGKWSPDTDVPEPVIDHGYGEPTVAPFVNRARVHQKWGRPEARDIWSLQEDVSRCFTDLAVAMALLAVPQRVAFGVAENETLDENGNQVPASQLYMARLLTFASESGKIAEYAAAQLSQFTSTAVAIARQASAQMGIPISYFGVASEANPSSGDAQREDDTRLVKRSLRLHSGFTRPFRQVFRLAARVRGVTDRQALAAIDVRWKDPGTITPGQEADYVTKVSGIKVSADQLVSPEFLLDKLGMTPEQIAERVANLDTGDLTTVLSALEAGGAGGNAETQSAA